MGCLRKPLPQGRDVYVISRGEGRVNQRIADIRIIVVAVALIVTTSGSSSTDITMSSVPSFYGSYRSGKIGMDWNR